MVETLVAEPECLGGPEMGKPTITHPSDLSSSPLSSLSLSHLQDDSRQGDFPGTSGSKIDMSDTVCWGGGESGKTSCKK